MHFVYIVRCADGSLYTGYARDPQARVKVHNAGRGAKYTAGRRPVALVYAEKFRARGAALRREYELKSWSRAEKSALLERWRASGALASVARRHERTVTTPRKSARKKTSPVRLEHCRIAPR